MKKVKYAFIGIAATASFFLPSADAKVNQVHSKAIVAVKESKDIWRRKNKGRGKNKGKNKR